MKKLCPAMHSRLVVRPDPLEPQSFVQTFGPVRHGSIDLAFHRSCFTAPNVRQQRGADPPPRASGAAIPRRGTPPVLGRAPRSVPPPCASARASCRDGADPCRRRAHGTAAVPACSGPPRTVSRTAARTRHTRAAPEEEPLVAAPHEIVPDGARALEGGVAQGLDGHAVERRLRGGPFHGRVRLHRGGRRGARSGVARSSPFRFPFARNAPNGSEPLSRQSGHSTLAVTRLAAWQVVPRACPFLG